MKKQFSAIFHNFRFFCVKYFSLCSRFIFAKIYRSGREFQETFIDTYSCRSLKFIKFEWMELNQKFNFLTKFPKNVAHGFGTLLPCIRITLRVEDDYPALRVTKINFLFEFRCFFCEFVGNLLEK